MARMTDIELESNLFDSKPVGKMISFDAKFARGVKHPFVVIVPNEIEEELDMVIIKDEAASVGSSLVKEENLAFNIGRPVIVPIIGEDEITASEIESIFEEAREYFYESDYPIGEKVIIVGWDYILPADIYGCSLEDEGLEVLVNNIFNYDNQIKR